MSSKTRKSISPLRAFFLIILIGGVLTGCSSDKSSAFDDSSTDSQDTDSASNPDGDNSEDTTDSADTLVPQVDDQTLVLQYQATIQGTIDFSGSDDPDSDPQLSIVTNPARGTVTLLDSATGEFEYQPVDADAWAGDSFTVQVDDAGLQSDERTVTLDFTDDTSPALVLTPSEGAGSVLVDTQLEMQSDDPIDLSSLTYSSNGTCSGSVQLSADNFTTCVGIEQHSVSSQTEIVFTLSQPLTLNTPYTWRLSSDISSVFGLAIEQAEVTFTTTPQPLLISEIGASPYTNIMRWFEIYNAGSAPLELADYDLRSRAIDATTSATEDNRTFNLPELTLQPGHYLIVRAQSSYANSQAVDTEQVIHLRDGDWRPYWYDRGFLEIIRTSDGQTMDFVTFGSNYAPSDSDAWSGAEVTSLTFGADSFGESIGRDPTLSDTDSASDWSFYSWATVGGPNDTCGTEDLDEDGIPDCNEQPGSTFAGMPLYEWGARAGQPDIFLEIDYLDSTNGGTLDFDEGVQPRQEALQKVVDAFAARDVAVHIDAGDLYEASPGLNPANFDMGGGEMVPYALGVDLFPDGTQAEFFDYKAAYFDYRRLPIFHYVIFGTSRRSDGEAGSSGVAELLGNDLIVSLGSWGLNSSNVASTNALINYQASTLMHELGHNLDLRHGGFENFNAKPNYLSIMNYVYQLRGLPVLGSNEGDRYYYDYELDDCQGNLINGPFDDPADFGMDFSDGTSIDLDPTNIDESLGLGRATSGPVDFNCNGNDSELNVNATGILGATVMSDHDDWSNMVIDFGGYSMWSNNGATQPRSLERSRTNAILRFVNPVTNDRGPVIEEPSPPTAVLNMIRSRQVSQ